MAERVGRIVGSGRRRRIGLGVSVTVLIVVAALLVAGVLTAAPSAKTRHQAQAPAPSGQTPQQAAISAKVSALLSKMTVAEKFGQLEMSGPQGPNGTAGQRPAVPNEERDVSG